MYVATSLSVLKPGRNEEKKRQDRLIPGIDAGPSSTVLVRLSFSFSHSLWSTGSRLGPLLEAPDEQETAIVPHVIWIRMWLDPNEVTPKSEGTGDFSVSVESETVLNARKMCDSLQLSSFRVKSVKHARKADNFTES